MKANQRRVRARLLTTAIVTLASAFSASAQQTTGTTGSPSATAPAPSRPLNVILVLRDQTRYELPAAAGYNMPALDRLAQQGITFRNHYVASAMCTPSRAALWSWTPP